MSPPGLTLPAPASASAALDFAVVAFLLLALAVGAYQDLRRGRISTPVNVAVLAALAVSFILSVAGTLQGDMREVSSLVASFLALSLFLLSWAGPADAKFLMAAVLSLSFDSAYQPFWFVAAALVLWVAFPTREGLRRVDPRLVAAMLLVVILSPPLGALLIFLYMSALKYQELKHLETPEGGEQREHFPFLHVLLITVVLHIFAPEALYFAGAY